MHKNHLILSHAKPRWKQSSRLHISICNNFKHRHFKHKTTISVRRFTWEKAVFLRSSNTKDSENSGARILLNISTEIFHKMQSLCYLFRRTLHIIFPESPRPSYHKLILTRAGDGEGSLLLFSNNTINLTLRKCQTFLWQFSKNGILIFFQSHFPYPVLILVEHL